MHIPVLFVIWELLRGIFFFPKQSSPPFARNFSAYPQESQVWRQFFKFLLSIAYDSNSSILLFYSISFIFLLSPFISFFPSFFSFSPSFFSFSLFLLFFLLFYLPVKIDSYCLPWLKGIFQSFTFPICSVIFFLVTFFSFSSFPVFCYFIQENEYITHSILWQTDIIRLCIGKRNYNSYVS